MIELLAPVGLLLVLFALGRSLWRLVWWRARFEATMARELPATSWPDHGVEGVPLGVVARRAVNVHTQPAPRELGGRFHHPRQSVAEPRAVAKPHGALD